MRGRGRPVAQVRIMAHVAVRHDQATLADGRRATTRLRAAAPARRLRVKLRVRVRVGVRVRVRVRVRARVRVRRSIRAGAQVRVVVYGAVPPDEQRRGLAK